MQLWFEINDKNGTSIRDAILHVNLQHVYDGRHSADHSSSSSSASVASCQDPSSNDEQRSRRPADVDGGSQLPSPLVRRHWVVKSRDDDVSRPADGNDAQHACDDKHHSSTNSNVGFHQPVVAAEVGAPNPNDAEPDGHNADANRGADESPRALQVLRQGENGVIGLALQLTCALDHAVHPQTFPKHLSGDNVGSNKCRHLPHGQSADENRSHEADDCQAKTNQLSPHCVEANVSHKAN